MWLRSGVFHGDACFTHVILILHS